ncbi:MAG: alanine racemase [Candidatus Yanofskybacteria bacterium]|nr:alanine racemase [Candidatus Yanofskybacteria bacterium]
MQVQNLKTWVEVSKRNLEHNIKTIKSLTGDKLLMGVVKSNAYGHGLVETAKLFLKYGVDWLGVDNVDEAVLLRKAKINSPVLVLGYTPVALFSLAARYKIKLTLYGEEIFNQPSKFKKGIDFHLKIDTGMSRQGVLVSDLPIFLSNLKNFPEIKIEGVFTHFANADNLSDPSYPRQQLANFREALEIIKRFDITPKIIHAAATTGLFALPEAMFDMVRVGVAFYGLWPSQEFKNRFSSFNLKPALNWKTRIVQIKKIPKGTPVGYGITEKVKKDSLIALLPIGYYDGYFRALSSIGEVLVSGRRCKILGRISMNLSVVDVSAVNGAKVGDEMVLIGQMGGERVTAEEIAKKLGTISYEVVSRINPLLPRIYI